MYTSAYARFSGGAEAGFASRGMSVSGGAFASTLARETGRMSFEGANIESGMEREDIRSVDSAYGSNSGAYMSGLAGGVLGEFAGGRANAAGFGSLLADAGKLSRESGGFGIQGPRWMSGPRVGDSVSYPMRSNDYSIGNKLDR